MKKKILILMLEVGLGHKIPALAIKEELEMQYPDAFDISPAGKTSAPNNCPTLLATPSVAPVSLPKNIAVFIFYHSLLL